MNKNDFSRRISLCHRFFHISPQMMSYIDFSKKIEKSIFLKSDFLIDVLNQFFKNRFLNLFFKSIFLIDFKKSFFFY